MGGGSYLQLGEPREITKSVWMEGVTVYRIKPDRKKRKNARKSLREIYKYLPDQEIRKEAGKTLGYSQLRIWFHELSKQKPNFSISKSP